MKQIILSILSVMLIAVGAQAQSAEKVVLTKGQKVKMTTESKSNKTQAQRGDMKTDLKMVSELEVVEITDKGYKVNVTLKKAKMKFESSFFSDDYDSEDEKKKGGQIAKGFEKVINKAKTVLLGFDGKIIKDPSDANKQNMMMRMMGGGADASAAVEGAFLIMPKGLEVGKKWRTTTEEDGLKVITEYTYNGMIGGDMVNLAANQQTKGEVSGGRQFTSKINNLTQMTLLVSANTGLIKLKTITTKDSSATEMGGETYNSTGKTNTTVTCD